MYDIDDYYYELPENLISQRPPLRRGNSRLLRMRRKTGDVSHHLFSEIDHFLKPSDVLVINDTKVFPGKLNGKKKSGGKIELLILDFGEKSARLSRNTVVFQCLIKASRRAKSGTALFFEHGLKAEVVAFFDGIYSVKFENGKLLKKVISKFGHIPLPPYIKRRESREKSEDVFRYQTVYAEKIGAIAAPTAGLHITEEIMKRVESVGVKIVRITLHVGYGTFVPVRVHDIRDHKMHSEWFSVSSEVATAINSAKSSGHRVVAVGTTTVRTLEFLAQKKGLIKEAKGKCDLFMYPGHTFNIVDAMITNFHIPRSTLLMLVSAFSSRERLLNAYECAVREKYHFFSYGDAMFID